MERNITNTRIRIALPDDAPSIASVLHESFIEYKSSYTEEGFAATTPTSGQIENRMKEGPLWVALNDNTIVGTVSAVPKGAALYIRGMGVLPTARGQRIGELLLRHIESYASERGFTRLFLSTTPFLSRAIRLYETSGFMRSSEGPHDLFGTPLFTMEKTLEPSDEEGGD
jgi:ribosomal protein S18 acetylase RimI-like enzyme